MPLFFRPRRPLLRGAVVGGTAFLAGCAGSSLVPELTKLKGLLAGG
jgi:hypothetical protein